MFSRIWGVLGIARHAVALVILTGATTGLVAGSLDVNSTSRAAATSTANTATVTANKNTNIAELEVLVRMCLETKDPQSDVCAKAIEKSGMSADEFWARIAMSLNEQVNKKHEPKHEDRPTTAPKPDEHKVPTGELIGLVTACVESHERSSEPCEKARDLSGLSADEFWAKVSTLFNRPAVSPTTERPTSEALYALIKGCLAKYENARTTNDGGTAASDACKKAIEASGLSSSDFWAKFGPKHESTKPSETPKTTTSTEGLSVIIGACLQKLEAAKNGTYTEPISTSEACRKAYDASGLTPEQFWARFGPKPTTTSKPQPTPTAKPQTTQSVSDADLIVMVKYCFAKYLTATASKGNEDLGRAASEACTKAMAASGLTNDAFWAKFGTPQSPKI